MIDRELKRCLGQMIKGVQVVAATYEGVTRAYCSHWVCQISFEEPIILVSVSPKHDTHSLMRDSGRFAVSILSGDQIEEGQYFSYPGRRFQRIAAEWITEMEGWPVVPRSLAWLGCEIENSIVGKYDHDLFFARVVEFGEGRLGEPPLLPACIAPLVPPLVFVGQVPLSGSREEVGEAEAAAAAATT